MSIITLTSDFGTKDHFVGAIKGAIYSELPDITIVDITHKIAPFNIIETSYILRNSYKNFPKGTVHIIGVDSELSEENKHIAVELDGYFFICADNGVIAMIANEINPTKIVEINIHKHIEDNFPVLNTFVKVATHIARGGNLNVIGREIKTYKKVFEIQPKINSENTLIKGEVIYIDNYGNVISNISKKLFNSVGRGRSFTVAARGYKFKKIYTKYSDIIDFSIPPERRYLEGERLVLFNSSDFLEISIYKSNPKTHGGASSLLGLKYRDTISVTFDEQQK